VPEPGAPACPDDASPLAAAPDGLLSCKRCGGALCSASELDALIPDATETLMPETRQESAAFRRMRRCPACQATLVPLRIGRLEAWVERCPTCETYWLDRLDRSSLSLVARQQARVDAFASFSAQERQELAADLAQAAAPDEPAISPFHRLLASVGLPVVTRTSGARTPVMTWALSLLLVLAFVACRATGLEPAEAAWGYHSDVPSLVSALTANAIHGGWFHLLGNVYFLLAFGDGVEQRVPRPLFLGAFAGFGALSLAIQGWTATAPQLIFGASGAIAVLMGACAVLQPQARVVTAFIRAHWAMPLWLYMGFELLFQAAMAASGEPGVAWTAHLSGLLLGAALGGAVRLMRRNVSAPAAS
jgi:membrane associated rhomboid family serine protease